MARRCEITGTGVLTGNNVSHANNKSRRRYLPNLQDVSLLSEALGEKIKLKVTANTLRSIEHNGGLDAYLTTTSSTKLTDKAVTIKNKINKALKADA
ncbi:MAG: 50S ribosomal protein L28 [Alphaproteobacteria bacterium]|nr:50S ribosomal protein L28 [Alphaproteobacteria bacterium]